MRGSESGERHRWPWVSMICAVRESTQPSLVRAGGPRKLLEEIVSEQRVCSIFLSSLGKKKKKCLFFIEIISIQTA